MKIALLGYGKMGKEIEKIAVSRGHEIVLKINVDNAKDLTVENLKKADAAIEFSTPETAYSNIQKCFEANVPVVVGTTGWLHKIDEVKNSAANEGKGFFYASNFSIGVNVFFEINKKLAQLMAPYKEYSIEMEEIHHTQKLDAPSGTAITLAEGIIENNPILAIAETIIFSKFNEMNIERPDKFGGNVSYSNYKDLKNDFEKGKIHPGDLKQTVGNYLVKIISPIREKLNLSDEISEAIKKSF